MDGPESSEPTPAGDDEDRMPRWVRVFILAAVVAVVVAVALLAIGNGGHGPARHLPDGSASAQFVEHTEPVVHG